jgi:hypothetical protein
MVELSVDILEPIERRVERDRSSGPAALLQAQLFELQARIKLSTCGLLSLLSDETNGYRHDRYRIEHKLVRGNGLGDWVSAFRQLVSGNCFMPLKNQLSASHLSLDLAALTATPQRDSWRHRINDHIDESLALLDEKNERAGGKLPGLLHFIDKVVVLRNKIAHGAAPPSTQRKISQLMDKSLYELRNNFEWSKMPFAHVCQDPDTADFSITWLVKTPLSVPVEQYLELVTRDCRDAGIYLLTAGFVSRVRLMSFDVHGESCYFANGDHKKGSRDAEFLCYASGSRRRESTDHWNQAPSAEQTSDSAGLTDLRAVDKVLSNAPSRAQSYVPRPVLESQVLGALRDRRRRIITMHGPGATGKTSLATSVVEHLKGGDDFDLILWFSARDVDISVTGQKPVRPDVRDLEGISQRAKDLLRNVGTELESDNPHDWLNKAMTSEPETGRILWIFDNFETLDDPVHVFQELDRVLTGSHKILITTRHTGFTGDFGIQIGGLEFDEFDQLVRDHCISINLELHEDFDIRELWRQIGGHPMIARLLLSEYKRFPKTFVPKARDVALKKRDDLLTSLFERSYNNLDVDSQYILLLLGKIKQDAIPLDCLEVSLQRPVEQLGGVEECVTNLVEHSFARRSGSGSSRNQAVSLFVPARVFSELRQTAHPYAHRLSADAETLRLFFAASDQSVGHFADAVDQLWRNVTRGTWSSAAVHERLEVHRNTLERCAELHPALWQRLGMAMSDVEKHGDACSFYTRYLQFNPLDQDVRRELIKAADRAGQPYVVMAQVAELAESGAASPKDLLRAGKLVNRHLRALRQQKQALSRLQKRLYVEPIISGMERVVSCGSPDDLPDFYSTMGWLYVNVSELDKSRKVATLGLQKHPDDENLLKLNTLIDEWSRGNP